MAVTVPVEITVETRESKTAIHARWASLRLNGMEIFSDLVYDTGENGERSDEQAALNLMRIFTSKVRELLEEGS